MVDFKFALGDRVKIKELELFGKITILEVNKRGICYEVRYFWNGEGKAAYFYEDELTA